MTYGYAGDDRSDDERNRSHYRPEERSARDAFTVREAENGTEAQQPRSLQEP